MKKLLIIFAFIIQSGCEPTTPQNADFNAINETIVLPDFSTIQDIKAKKQAFFDFLLPLVIDANREIASERVLVDKWLASPQKLNLDEQQQLNTLLVKYRVVNENLATQKELLSRRVNVLPPSLVLAQAANESAWGTSRFAQEGNNLFGQWCFNIGCGIIPGERNHRSRHEVQIFESPFDSVQSYMRNLNSHPQYQDFRILRDEMLAEQGEVNGLSLAEGLVGYSVRREHYVEEIKKMIRHNRLQSLDTAPLGKNNDD